MVGRKVSLTHEEKLGTTFFCFFSIDLNVPPGLSGIYKMFIEKHPCIMSEKACFLKL